MIRVQAIFLETMDDLCFEGYTELLILAYDEFLTGFDFSTAEDLEIHRRAKAVIKRYQDYWINGVTFFDVRHEILDQLDLSEAEWEYLDTVERVGEPS